MSTNNRLTVNNTSGDEDLKKIADLYSEAFSHYDNSRTPPPVRVEYYPYVGINHTIRIRSGIALVRIGEICRGMPLSAHRSLAFILVAKLFRRRAAKRLSAAYSEYIQQEEVRQRSLECRRDRGRKIVTGPTGDHFDLDAIFDELNNTYFAGKLEKPVLTWSARRTYRILGHHDATHDTIVISRSLDSAATPRFVLEYVLFHEMLHVFHPTVHHNGRRYNHTPAFRRDERKFKYFDEAERWIEKNVRRMRRAARKG